jgi:hypothetical protein
MNIFENDGFHMHGIVFEDAYMTIRYTHQEDSTGDLGLTNEVHIPYTVEDEEIKYWVGELNQSVEELVAHTQRALRDSKKQLRSV